MKQNAIALSPDNKDGSPWDIVGDAIKKLTQEAASVVPVALEAENVMKSMFWYLPFRKTIQLLISH